MVHKLLEKHAFIRYAAFVCGASKGCSSEALWRRGALLVAALAVGCGSPPKPALPADAAGSQGAFELFTAAPAEPSRPHPSCAWYGDARGALLYFGESAFWSATREQGSPLAEFDSPGPRRIGRFDLEAGRMLPALQLAKRRPSGTWDVLVHPDGRVYFTTFFDLAGSVDPATGDVVRFADAGKGLNEWERGPDDTLLASRYAGADGAGGSLVWLDRDGSLRADFPLKAPPGSIVAPKTVAFDPLARVAWITTDLLTAATDSRPARMGHPATPGGAGAHPTLIVDLEGRERGRITDVEIQFARFGPDATGYFAVVDGTSLQLAILPAGAGADSFARARRIVLDEKFTPGFDFAQDLRVEEGGRVLVTTWSGGIYVVEPDAPEPVRSFAFPRLADGGLYYAAASAGERLCATYCAALTVVCTRLE